jgi:predicted MPP superfamily phosphohydrolase
MMKPESVSGIREDFSFRFRKGLQNLMSRYSGLVGQRFDPAHFEVVKLGIDIPGLSPSFHGYRIVHISDIHYGQWISAARMAGVAELINNQRPDLVAITGDFVSYSGQNVGDMAAGLKAIHARDAVVQCWETTITGSIRQGASC